MKFCPFHDDLSGMLRVQAHQAFEHFASPGSHKSIDSKHFAFLQFEVQVIHQVAAARLWKA